MAINKFEGGVVLVSHDERLIELCADELWHVERRQVPLMPSFLPSPTRVASQFTRCTLRVLTDKL